MLVIAESPGSLAELGAVATNETIRQALRVIIQETHATANSFVRYGPIERIIKNHGRERVGVYDWRINSSNQPIIKSVLPHYRSMINFMNDHVRKIPASTQFPIAPDQKLFCIMYWIIYILIGVSEDVLNECVISVLPDADLLDISNKIYCMILAGWIRKFPYGGKDYYYVTVDDDPSLIVIRLVPKNAILYAERLTSPARSAPSKSCQPL